MGMYIYIYIYMLSTSLEEAKLLAGVEDSAAKLAAATGQVDNGQGDVCGGHLRLWERLDSITTIRERSAGRAVHMEQVFHG
jgi:hypothetical protein